MGHAPFNQILIIIYFIYCKVTKRYCYQKHYNLFLLHLFLYFSPYQFPLSPCLFPMFALNSTLVLNKICLKSHIKLYISYFVLDIQTWCSGGSYQESFNLFDHYVWIIIPGSNEIKLDCMWICSFVLKQWMLHI